MVDQETAQGIVILAGSWILFAAVLTVLIIKLLRNKR